MSIFDDPIEHELNRMRVAGFEEESKHDCEGCKERIGIPCLVAKSCKKLKNTETEK